MRYLLLLLLFVFCGCGLFLEQFGPRSLLHKYEWFKNQHEQIQQIERRLESSEKSYQDLKSENPQDWQSKDELRRLSSIKEGYRSQYNALAAEYNSQSKKFNWSGLKTYDLPQSVEYK